MFWVKKCLMLWSLRRKPKQVSTTLVTWYLNNNSASITTRRLFAVSTKRMHYFGSGITTDPSSVLLYNPNIVEYIHSLCDEGKNCLISWCSSVFVACSCKLTSMMLSIDTGRQFLYFSLSTKNPIPLSVENNSTRETVHWTDFYWQVHNSSQYGINVSKLSYNNNADIGSSGEHLTPNEWTIWLISSSVAISSQNFTESIFLIFISNHFSENYLCSIWKTKSIMKWWLVIWVTTLSRCLFSQA